MVFDIFENQLKLCSRAFFAGLQFCEQSNVNGLGNESSRFQLPCIMVAISCLDDFLTLPCSRASCFWRSRTFSSRPSVHAAWTALYKFATDAMV